MVLPIMQTLKNWRFGMTKEVQVTVSFPQTFTIEIDLSLPIEEQRELIKNHASYLMETSESDPIITDCSRWVLIE
jgi:hypothetical protein